MSARPLRVPSPLLPDPIGAPTQVPQSPFSPPPRHATSSAPPGRGVTYELDAGTHFGKIPHSHSLHHQLHRVGSPHYDIPPNECGFHVPPSPEAIIARPSASRALRVDAPPFMASPHVAAAAGPPAPTPASAPAPAPAPKPSVVITAPPSSPGRGRGAGRGTASNGTTPTSPIAVGAGRGNPDSRGSSRRGRPAARAPRGARDPSDNVGHSALAEKLIGQLESGSYECMVCCDIIKRESSVWSCETCSAIFHLKCIQEWSTSSSVQKLWRCPGCQTERSIYPSVYSCFCGKVRDPAVDYYTTPHSCGESCLRPRRGTPCPHPCDLRCHPGPCPPCSLFSPEKTCACGRLTYRTRCSDTDPPRSCSEVCDKALACGHTCAVVCHSGACPPCPAMLVERCFCGRQEEERACGSRVKTAADADGIFSCAAVCGEKLPCGFHSCERLCHAGDCTPCVLVSTCPCGQTPLKQLLAKPRTKCTDPVPLCDKTCQRYRPCGMHVCGRPCHDGPCAPEGCQEAVTVPCRCSRGSKVFSCAAVQAGEAAEVLCGRVCETLRSCGKHRCNRTCCIGVAADGEEDPHLCTLPCLKELRCGQHRCEIRCHRAHCPPCSAISFDPLVCACGRTSRPPPIPCGVAPPECPHPCSKQSCGHPAQHQCHPEGIECAPCLVPVSRLCNGRHGWLHDVACSAVDAPCDAQCARRLPCGQHRCVSSCHAGPCPLGATATPEALAAALAAVPTGEPSRAQAPAQAGVAVHGCGHTCGMARAKCGHTCQAPCHPGVPCPAVACRELVELPCRCGTRKMRVECGRGGAVEEAPVVTCEACAGDGAAAAPDAKVAVAVDAVPVSAADAAPCAPYTPFLRQYLTLYPDRVANVEAAFASLIADPVAESCTVPVADSIGARFVHELAPYYHLQTQTTEPTAPLALPADAVPGATVLPDLVVTKKPSSRRPPILLSAWESALAAVVEVMASPYRTMITLYPKSKPLNALCLYALPPSATTPRVLAFLAAWAKDCALHWVTESAMLAVFWSEGDARRAYTQLWGGDYRVALVLVEREGAVSKTEHTRAGGTRWGGPKTPGTPVAAAAPPAALAVPAADGPASNGPAASAVDALKSPKARSVVKMKDGGKDDASPARPGPMLRPTPQKKKFKTFEWSARS